LGVAVKRNPLVLLAEHVSPNIVCGVAQRYIRPATAFTAGRVLRTRDCPWVLPPRYCDWPLLP